MVKHTDTHKAFLIKLGGMISSQNSKCKWVRINRKEPKYLHFVSIFVKRNSCIWFDRRKSLYQTKRIHREISQANMWTAVELGENFAQSKSLLLFSCSAVSDSLWPLRLQHASLPCPSLSPGFCSDSCPLSQWCHPTISSSVFPFSSRLQSFPAS